MKMRNIFLVAVLVAFGTVAQATTHEIKFGNTLGLVYEPQFLTGVEIGDTILFHGHFQFHPMLSTLIPPGATPFVNDGVSHDTLMIYVPQFDGAYGYYCTAHGTPNSGMYGEFVVGDLGVDDPEHFALTAFPNPVSENLNISFSLTSAGNSEIVIFDMHGKQVTTTRESFGAGENTTSINVATLPAGVYYYRLETPEGSAVRKFTVAR